MPVSRLRRMANALALVVPACGGRTIGDLASGGPGDPGRGGASNAANDAGLGGSVLTGGGTSASSGGNSAKGRAGASSHGGNVSNGGSGGVEATEIGDQTATGAATATGGVAATGGVGAMGGSAAAAGSAGSIGGQGDAGPSGGPTSEVWVGLVQHAVTFPESTPENFGVPQHVVLVITHASSGDTGSIVFGENPPPPKATDPEAYYPPGFAWDSWNSLEQQPVNGATYTALEMRWEGNRLTFHYATGELWRDWCALQPKTYWTLYGFSCSPEERSGAFPVAAPLFPKSDLCSPIWGICECNPASCHAYLDRYNSYSWYIDVQKSGDTMEGEVMTESGGGSGVWTLGIRLHRVR